MFTETRCKKFISKVVHRRALFRGCWNQGKALGAAVHYRSALANEVPQKSIFPIGSAKALRHRVNICLGENDSHAKEPGGDFLGPSEAAQRLPEGVRPDLDDPGERVVELADGEQYAADQ